MEQAAFLTPFINFDPNTLEGYVLLQEPNLFDTYVNDLGPTQVTQTYSVLAIDSNNQTSNVVTFQVSFIQ